MNTTTEQAMSLEEFEAKRVSHRGRVPGSGKIQRWIRDLLPLTPTQYPLDGKDARNVAGYLTNAWAAYGPGRTLAMRDEMGGNLRTTINDGDLWVVWYPPTDSNGAS